MRIAYIIPSLDNKGPIIVVNYLVKYLIDRVEHIDVYYFDVLDKGTLQFDCPVHHIKMSDSISFDTYDIIHSHCLRPDLYVNKWRKSIHKAKIISTLHQDTYQSLMFQYGKILSYFVTYYWLYVQSKFDGVTCISHQLKDSYNKRLKNKGSVIYNGCLIKDKTSENLDEDVLLTINSLKNKNLKIVSTYAYVTKRKGLEQVINILPDLTDLALVIMGDGPEIDNLRSLSVKLGISDRVLFFPSHKYPYLYLDAADMYVMPSYSEGFGMAMVEAAFQQKSILCSDIDSFHEIFTPEEATFFKLNDPESLSKGIDEAYRTRKIKGEKAFEKVNKNFTAEIMAENFLEYYNRLLN